MSAKSWVKKLYLLLVLTSGELGAAPDLNGVAAYSELGNELFIAALYAGQTGTNAQELINRSYPKRLELKILTNQGITQRQFSRIWRESVAINNSRDALIAQAENMVYFEELIRDRLESNDHLVIAYSPKRGVNISLNSVVLGRVNDDGFFTLLLRSWIGSVPSSTAFRDDLLNMNNPDSTLVSRFNAMSPRGARIEVAKRWLEATEPTPEPADEPPAFAKAEVLPVKPVAVKDKLQPTKEVEEPVFVTQTVLPADPVAVQNTPSNSAPGNLPTVVQEPMQKPVAPSVSSEPMQGLSKAQMLLAKQFYSADVFKKIYARVDYPRRAQQLRQTGSVRLSVVIDSAGNVKTVEPVEESDFVMLNKAALAAVHSAAPFAPLPEGLDIAELELSVPITFSLAEP